jgi:DNA-binding XRE family transcriptional regulator
MTISTNQKMQFEALKASLDEIDINFEAWRDAMPDKQLMSRRSVARLLGCTDSTLFGIEKELNKPSLMLLFKFSALTSTPLEKFVLRKR